MTRRTSCEGWLVRRVYPVATGPNVDISLILIRLRWPTFCPVGRDRRLRHEREHAAGRPPRREESRYGPRGNQDGDERFRIDRVEWYKLYTGESIADMTLREQNEVCDAGHREAVPRVHGQPCVHVSAISDSDSVHATVYTDYRPSRALGVGRVARAKSKPAA